jgi:hypothetical protein
VEKTNKKSSEIINASKDKTRKDKEIIFDSKEEFLNKEIAKYERNIDHIDELISMHKQMMEEKKTNKSEKSDSVLNRLLEKKEILENEVLTKKLELELHKDKIHKEEEFEEDKIDYEDYFQSSRKDWKDRFHRWKENIKPEIKNEKDNKTKKKVFKPYRRDFFLRFTYDIVGSKISYPFNCFILSLILLLIYILPTYLKLGLESFYYPDVRIGILESSTFMMVVVLIPIALIVLKYIFKKYGQTFMDLRDVAKVTDKDYQEFITLSNSTLQSRYLYFFWIGAWIGIVILMIYIFNNPTAGDIADEVGISAYIGILLIYIITSTIVISLAWFLISMVRTIRRFTEMPLDIRPLDPDNAAGLKPLANLSFGLSMVSLLGVAGIMFSLFIGGRNISEPQVIIFLVFLISFMIVLFVLPLSKAHSVMDENKSEILKILSTEHAFAYKRIKEEIPKAGPCITEDSLTELQGIAELYDRANSMPVWPFDFKTISNLMVAIGLPLFLIFLQQFIFGA